MNVAVSPKDVAQNRPQDIKFAYWVPNVSGGLVISNIEQRTDWDLDYNVKLAQIAETDRLRLCAEPDPLHCGLRRRIPARIGVVQPCAARRDTSGSR